MARDIPEFFEDDNYEFVFKSKLTNQEVFNRVATHLFKQGERCSTMAGNRCLYRGDSLKCAIGAIIPDKVYCPTMEGKGIVVLLESHQHQELNNLLRDINGDLLNSLQEVHDRSIAWESTAKMKERLHRVACAYHLNSDVLNGLRFSDR